jgi:methionine-rich copper-binding protein CopC
MFKRLIAVFILFIFPISILAHSPLEQASPMDGAILTTPPTEYKIRFKSPAKLIKIEIYQKSQSAKKKVSLLENIFKKSEKKLVKLNYKPSLALSRNHSINLPEIKFGSYEVRWRAMGEDGHVLKGILTFEIKGK